MENIIKKSLNSHCLSTKKILKLIEQGYEMHEISRKKKPVSCISKWISNRNNIENPLYSNKFKKLPAGGRKPFILNCEIYLCKYIDDLQKLDIPVTTSIVISKAIPIILGFNAKYIMHTTYGYWISLKEEIDIQ